MRKIVKYSMYIVRVHWKLVVRDKNNTVHGGSIRLLGKKGEKKRFT